MDNSKMNQTQLKYHCKEVEVNLNLYTGKFYLDCPLLSIGANHYQIAISIVYHLDRIKNTLIGFENGWKLNIDQYVGAYQPSYAFEGYQLGDYVYIDSDWQTHRFIQYKEENIYNDIQRVYYDESGTGLRLTVYSNNTSQIKDQNGNLLRFNSNGRLSEMISGVNHDISKKIEYIDNQIVAIYDTRKSHRKIRFIYEEGHLSKIMNSKDDMYLSFTYDENQDIVAIQKGHATASKEMMHFQYHSFHQLQYMVSLEDKEALQFLYETVENDFRIFSIRQGVARTIYTYRSTKSEGYCGEDMYLSEGTYLTDTSKCISGYHYELPASYITHISLFTYLNGATIVKNEKQIETIYYFNSNGFTVGILEKVGENIYKTLFKTGGWSLLTGVFQSGGSKMNNKFSAVMKQDHDNNLYTYQVDQSSLNYFVSQFYDEGSTKNKYYYVKNFTLSFWIRFSKPLTKNYKFGIIANTPNGTVAANVGWLHQTKENCWQYVTIPLHLGFNKNNISSIVFNIYHLSDGMDIEIADLRMAIADSTQIYIDELAWDKATSIVYEQNGVNHEEAIDNNCFMNEQDIFLTYQNIFHSQKEARSTFDFIYCGGTKVKEVSSVKIKKDGKTYPLLIQNEGMPNYYIRSVNQTANNQYNITESQIKFNYDSTSKWYGIENHTSVGYTKKETDVLSQLNSSSIYTVYSEQGMLLKERDAYQVVTEHHYDAYGNLDSTCIYNEGEQNGEKLTIKYGYGNQLERFRERPLSYTENDITRYYVYNEPYMTTHTNQIEDSTTKWSYDDYHEKTTKLEYYDTSSPNALVQQMIQYDQYGRIKSVKDQTGQTYGFFYHLCSEPFKYFENRKLILEKKINRNQKTKLYGSSTIETLNYADVIMDCVYQSDALDSAKQTTTIMDSYGRVREQTNGNHVICYQYQDKNALFTESSAIAKIEKIHDPYQQTTYFYHYDEENRPCGYEVRRDGYPSEKKFQVMQTASGDTQYCFNDDHIYIKSKIILEDTQTSEGKQKQYINPRTYRTQYVQVKSEQSDKENNLYKAFDYTYEYDSLGRLNAVCHNRYYGNEIFEQTMGTLKDSRRYYKPNTNFIEKIEHHMVHNFRYGYPQTINTLTEATITENIVYDDKGNILKTHELRSRLSYPHPREIINEKGQKILSICEQVKMDDYKTEYQYNTIGQLKHESNSKLGEYEYVYDQNTNQLVSVRKNQTEIKRFTYDKGRKIKVYIGEIEKNILYDHYGNIIQDHKATITYNNRNQLESYCTELVEDNWCYRYYNTYSYNYQGVRYRKKFTHTCQYGLEEETKEKEIITFYDVDGNKILGEEWLNASGKSITTFRYFYDIEGITGLSYNEKNYNYLKDVLGNITKITYQGRILAEYVYDAWGNCQVNTIDVEDEDESFVVRYNPFRWKSRYCDLETGNYYVDGRYYSPVLMQYLKAEPIENMLLQVNTLNSLDRYAITYTNPLVYASNPTTIYNNQVLYPDPDYQPQKHKSWWELHWRKVIQWTLFTLVLVTSIVLMCTPAHSFGVGMFVAGMKAAASGVLVGGIIGSFVSVLQGNGLMEGLVEGIVNGFINGFTTGALFFSISELIHAYANTANTYCTSDMKCFKEGTLVLTKEGNKPIEDIRVGDEVWAYDEETGEKALKKVVQLFRNTTKQWTQVEIESEEGIQTITCTPGHKFYIPENKQKRDIGKHQEHESYYYLSEKWVRAIDLKIKDKVLLENGKYGIIRNVTLQQLETPETTYNFEVEDYHTYYVGNTSILTHNTGGPCQLNPSDIRYTQNNGGRLFTDGDYAGKSVEDLIASLKNGDVTPNDIPVIEVFRHSDGNIYSINNRRLYAFKMAGVDRVPVKWVSRNSMKHIWTGNGVDFYLRK